MLKQLKGSAGAQQTHVKVSKQKSIVYTHSRRMLSVLSQTSLPINVSRAHVADKRAYLQYSPQRRRRLKDLSTTMASFISAVARAQQCQMVNLTQLLTEDYPDEATSAPLTTHRPLPQDHVLNDYIKTFYFYSLSSVSHLILIGITIALSKKCFEVGLEKTSEHAFYCTLAFVLLIGECILVRNAYDLWDILLSPQMRDLAHVMMAITALLMGIYGIGIKYLHKRNRVNKDGSRTSVHFRTQHGFYGILGPLLFLISIVLGFVTYFMEARMPVLLPLHRVCALLSFLLLSIAQFLGYNTGFARRNLSKLSIKWYKLLTVIVFVTTINYSFRIMLMDIVILIPTQILDVLNLKN